MKFLIILLTGFLCFGQAGDITKDTLQLNELVVSSGHKKHKIKKVKLEGVCSYPEDMKDVSEIITLVDGLPKGKLGTVTFYFNKLDNDTYKKIAAQFKERDFEIVIYDVNNEGLPGMPSTIEKQTLIIDKTDKGKITVNLSFLNIDTQKKMFIGLRKLTDDTQDKSFYLDCLCNGQAVYATYTREHASSPWERRWSCAALKLEVNVEVK